MCGIVGFTGENNSKLLHKQLKSIRHRGRDDTAAVFSHGLNFGMNRLAILDLTRGLYPMRYKHYILLYNGEIYNFKTLQKHLQTFNIRCKTSCDAEVILPLYDKYGSKAFSLLEGMYAISILNTKTKEIILCRDKAGEKPLYYYHDKSIFVYASETRAILIHPGVKMRLDKTALIEYTDRGYAANKSLIRGIRKVAPSEMVVFSLKTHTLRSKKYWSIPLRNSADTGTRTELVGKLDELIRASVNMRLLADVPVGCFLSGGIDSSIITNYAVRQQPDILTYSVAFPGYKQEDESFYASTVAKWLRTKHTIIECTPQKVIDIVENVGSLIDDPISDPAFIPTLIMAKEARKKVKVVLTGEGADELFAGYTRYSKHLMIEVLRNSPFLYKTTRLVSWLTGNRRLTNVQKKLTDRFHAQHIWKQEEAGRLLYTNQPLNNKHRFLGRTKLQVLVSMQASDFRGYLAEQLLMKVDKATMAENLEARAPYLDSRIVSFAFGLAQEHKIHNLSNKYILRLVAQKYFPKWFAWRAKHGFSVPLRDWFITFLRPLVIESITTFSRTNDLINTQFYKKIVDDHLERRFDNSDKIWSMIVLSAWLKQHTITR